MSKKFFAKYLAVEGEIKEGDLYLQNLVGIGFLNEIRTYTGGKLEARDKKVKLFLCSRDIQAGDKVYEILSDNSIGDEFKWTSEIAEYNDSESCFKVIGEILTPGIVENQEFTEKVTEYLTIK